MASGLAELAAGRWDGARTHLEQAVLADDLQPSERATAWEALSEARWWLGDVAEALAARERAYTAWREAGDDGAAARAGLWLAREYHGAVGNPAAARGWLTRSEQLAGDDASSALQGWLALTRAWLVEDPREVLRLAEDALGRARGTGDGDLEVLAMGRMALALISIGQPEEGLRHADAAMAAASALEGSLGSLALVCCDIVLATERTGDADRFAQWNDVVLRVAGQHGHPGLLSFCATCCAEVFAAVGDWAGAEAQLREVQRALATTGHRARCVAVEAKLAELLLLQGRIEEAEMLLAGDDSDATLLARARLALATGRPGLAMTLADRHCRRSGPDSLVTVPALAVVVDAGIAAGDRRTAETAAARLEAVAAETGNARARGRAALARARLHVAAGQRAADDLPARSGAAPPGDGGPTPGAVIAARAALEEALDHLAAAPGSLELAEAHLALAGLVAPEDPALAASEARAALSGFESAGARRRADEAAALLRTLGDRSRVGAKGQGLLTDREREVLRLVAQGLTNAEIAERLFISVKTAGNHVSNILTKLQLRSRAEAAAWAVVHLDPPEPASLP